MANVTVDLSIRPARKPTLIKQLTYQRMKESDDVREYIQKFFDTVEKLNEIDVDINVNLLSVMLLHSLHPTFDNFRCAIKSCDTLPSPESFHIKIIEESKARKHETRESNLDAMLAKKYSSKKHYGKNKDTPETKKYNKAQNIDNNKEAFKYKCHRYRKVGHKIVDCTERTKNTDNGNTAENLNLCAVSNISSTSGADDLNIRKSCRAGA